MRISRNLPSLSLRPATPPPITRGTRRTTFLEGHKEVGHFRPSARRSIPAQEILVLGANFMPKSAPWLASQTPLHMKERICVLALNRSAQEHPPECGASSSKFGGGFLSRSLYISFVRPSVRPSILKAKGRRERKMGTKPQPRTPSSGYPNLKSRRGV